MTLRAGNLVFQGDIIRAAESPGTLFSGIVGEVQIAGKNTRFVSVLFIQDTINKMHNLKEERSIWFHFQWAQPLVIWLQGRNSMVEVSGE